MNDPLLPQVDEILQDALENWVAPDGLMDLDPRRPGEWRKPYDENSLATVYCDNGVHFFALFSLLLIELGQSDFLYRGPFASCLVGADGLLRRNPGRSDLMPHDDVMSLAALRRFPDTLSVYCDVFSLLRRGKSTNENELLARIFVDSWFIDLCAGRELGFLKKAWAMGSLSFSICGKKDDSSGALLMWVKYVTLRRIVRSGGGGKTAETLLELADRWFQAWTRDRSFRTYFEAYFRNPEHPVRRLAGVLYR